MTGNQGEISHRVATNLRIAQAALRVSNVELAEVCGVTVKTVARWRKGHPMPVHQLERIATHLNRDPAWFLVPRNSTVKAAA